MPEHKEAMKISKVLPKGFKYQLKEDPTGQRENYLGISRILNDIN